MPSKTPPMRGSQPLRETCATRPCGFRRVPLAPVLRLVDHVAMGRRMDFEPGLAVRLVGMGVPVPTVPTHMCYFPCGLSHFKVVWDDVRLAWLYTWLAVGRLARPSEFLRRRAVGRTRA